MVASPRAANSANTRDHAIAQYLVTKVSWKGSYKRILTVTPSAVLTYNPETYQCTCQWELSEIEDVEVSIEKDTFVLRLDKSRAFRLTKVRFHCAARAHFLSLITKLRRHFAIQPVALSSVTEDAQAWKKYRCIEFFGDGSSQSFYLQVGVSAILLLDDGGRKMDSFPYIYLKKAASTHSHPDGIVLGTPYQERLFLCSQRNECLGDIYIAAGELGVELKWEESPLNVQLLRLRNSQAIDNPSIVCFEVLKASDDGSFFMEVQLILQGDALVEVHPKIRAVVARKYTKLLNIIRTEWDVETIGLEFAEGESLVVKLEARDQLIALLLLTCRENGYEHITLTSAEIKKNRVYYPHVIENSSESAGASMENFFLRRLLQTGVSGDENVVIGARGSPPGALLRRQSTPPESGWLQRKMSQRKRSEGVMMAGGGTRDSFETGESMNDFVSTSIAMEELNANIPLNEVSLFCQKEVLNSTVELLAEHFTSLVITLRRFVSAANAEIVTTLQALVRLSYSSHASLSDRMIPRVFDAIHELFLQQDFLTCYWCLKLLQCYFDPTRVEFIYGQRAKILQYVSTQRELLNSLVDLLPSSSPVSTRSSGYWLLGSDGVMEHMSPHSSMDSTLQSKEARLEKEMNAVFYEALFTTHYITIYLHEKGREQAGAKDGAKTGEAAQALREFNNNRGTGPLPRRRTMPAAFTATSATMADITSGIPAKQKHFLAEKLMEKHEFLMDSVVDTRLVRTCLSCVALIRFLTLELGEKSDATLAKASLGTDKPFKKNEAVVPSPPDDFSSRRAVIDQSFSTASGGAGGAPPQQQHRERPGATMRRGATVANFQDIHHPRDNQSALPNFGLEEVLEKRLKRLSEFLATYTAKIRTQNDRSHLFQGQRTIIVPLTGFSQSTDEFAVSEKTQSSDYMKLEHLEMVEVEEEDDGNDGEEDDDDDDDDEDDDNEDVREMNEFNLSFRNYSTDAPRSSNVFSEEQKDYGCHERERVPSSSTNLFRSSTFFFEQPGSSSPSDYHKDRNNERRTSVVDRQRRTKSNPAIRVDAHHCDACIGCNDVCDNVMCFFCSEKKYQLRTTFPDSPFTRTGSPATQQRRSAHPSEAECDNYVHMERKYSSCELKRHRSLRSCWVVVSGAVYDITDLLSVHPGGLQVLLQAAQQGADCASIMEEHPASARRVLSNYRLGEYYECEKRTLFP
ncbi:hypothetical protein Gpo141_00010535 [Globisporangium polare]